MNVTLGQFVYWVDTELEARELCLLALQLEQPAQSQAPAQAPLQRSDLAFDDVDLGLRLGNALCAAVGPRRR